MIPEKFEIHLCQAEEVLNRTESLSFDQSNKQRHLQQLRELFDSIKNNYKSFDTSELDDARQCINYFLLQDLEFLSHSSNNSLVPEEIVFCVQSVINEWIPNPEQYILTTSLNCKFNQYSFQFIPDEKLALLLPFLKKLGIEFESQLILLNIPEFHIWDYLANVVLFHEIGHFIDKKYKITDKIFNIEAGFLALKNSIAADKQILYSIWKNYYKEFFADVFAAQYISDKCSQYVNYIAYNSPASHTHPPTTSRIDIVSKFLKGNEQDDRIDLLQRYTCDVTDQELREGKVLEQRFSDIDDDFLDRKPISISEQSQLYSLFIKAWDCWIDSNESFPRELGLGLIDGYKELNALVQSSIRDYMNFVGTNGKLVESRN